MSLQQQKKKQYIHSSAKDVSIKIKDYILFKYFLKCENCFWNVTFSEETGYIQLDNKRINCPYYRQGKLKSAKIHICIKNN